MASDAFVLLKTMFHWVMINWDILIIRAMIVSNDVSVIENDGDNE